MTDPTTWRTTIDFVEPGTQIDLTTCDREPIHLSGAIQPAGCLLVLDHRQCIEAATTNAPAWFDGTEVRGRELVDVVGLTASELSVPRRLTIGGRACEAVAHTSTSQHTIVELCEVGSDEAPPVENALMDVIAAIEGAGSIAELGQLVAEFVRRTFDFDRVWLYRFAPDDHGEILAEAMAADERPVFLGLHYPASDIPAQARAIFVEERVRVIQDMGAPVALEPSLVDDTRVDLAGAVLRSVSPMHIRYLEHLGVQASMSLSLVVKGRLWGLISCHNYHDRRLIDAKLRTVAGTIARLVSLQIELLEQAEISARRIRLDELVAYLLSSVAGSESVLDGLLDASDELLELGGADGVMLRIGQRSRSVGLAPGEAAVEELFSFLDSQHASDPVVLDSIAAVVPSFDDDEVAGALALPLSLAAGNWVVWFRREFAHTVEWGDNRPRPEGEPLRNDETIRLMPSGSFAVWTEEVRHSSRPWEAATAEAITSLRSALGSLILRRSEQLARTVASLELSNAELDRFAYVAAHDLKEPLRGIFNYCEVLTESIEAEDFEDVALSARAIGRLSSTMAALVESLLGYATVGRSSAEPREVRVSEAVADATALVQQRIAETGSQVELVSDGVVWADPIQFTQVLANLLSNGIKYNRSDTPRVEIACVTMHDTVDGWMRWHGHNVDLPPPVVVTVSDNGIGIAPEHRERVFEVFRRLHGRDEMGGGTGAGLTIARRIAERHGGALWVEDNPGGGSRFCIALPEDSEVLPVARP